MQRILGYMRKAIFDYGMIGDGDRIAVGVSGGKDSLVLMEGLARLRRFIGIDYTVTAITLDPCFGGVPTDYTLLEEHCRAIGVPLIIKRTNIGSVIFDVRKEKSPCSLCARMRRGALHDAAKEAGCNKIALGHHFDDVVETFIMNLFSEGRVGCFSPMTYLSRKDLYMIRPLIYIPETTVAAAAVKAQLPITKSRCPADGYTNRQKTKEWLAEREKEDKGFKDRIFGALKRSGVDGWDGKVKRDDIPAENTAE